MRSVDMINGETILFIITSRLSVQYSLLFLCVVLSCLLRMIDNRSNASQRQLFAVDENISTNNLLNFTESTQLLQSMH